ncbi:hypothetical protein [Pseudomonas sp. GM60]|uniref:hypothetical protein n=1 Tax=Pseudomonas sp. GM60 TaxID=1144334 RepID=UPI0002706E94|nr:hypothetical protein [Pseudomonas sp. GM60]EJM77924.1 hypothetical protein PMI32_04736 [Pseudomonas sp. GM60]
MQLTTIERDNLNPELQERLACFEANKTAYIALQKQLTEVTQEDQRLKKKASELESQADRTDASWNAMAKSATIDQSKINEEIERSAKLRKEAQDLRLIAEARTDIHNKLVIQVAEARIKLVGVPSTINKEYHQALLARALKQEGTLDILLELFTLSRALFLKSLDEHDGLLARCNSMRERQTKTQELTWVTFGKEIEKLFDGAEKEALAPTLATMPPAVQKEIVVDTHVALRKLLRANSAA